MATRVVDGDYAQQVSRVTVLDGYSRYIVHWEIREHSKEIDIELVLQRALEKCPKAKPRIVSDNGPQFIANDFKSFIRLQGLTHVRTSPYYPQSNGKLERWHGAFLRHGKAKRMALGLYNMQTGGREMVKRTIAW